MKERQAKIMYFASLGLQTLLNKHTNQKDRSNTVTRIQSKKELSPTNLAADKESILKSQVADEMAQTLYNANHKAHDKWRSTDLDFNK